MSEKISNRLPFFIFSLLANPADQTRPNPHQFLIKSLARKSILVFHLFVVKRARNRRKKHQQIRYQIIRENFEIKFFGRDANEPEPKTQCF
jgi:hypothetical protein